MSNGAEPMAVVYFDSTAFLKLVVDEPGSDLAANLWDGCDAAVSSRLAYPEVCAALAAAGRSGRLNSRESSVAMQLWENFWSATRQVKMSGPVTERAGKLAQVHSLRGADAVHLASALALDSSQVLFAAWDLRLRAGAESAGMWVAPLA